MVIGGDPDGADDFDFNRICVSREDRLASVLTFLRRQDLNWGDLVLYVSDPSSKNGDARFEGMFGIPGRVEAVLSHWTSSQNSPTARSAIHEWILEYVKRHVAHEGHQATRDGLLQSRKKVVDEAFALNFSLMGLYDRLRALCPTMAAMLREFSMTTRQMKTLTAKSEQRNDQRVGAALMSLLGERSQNNSYAKHVVGLYLYASGAQRQTISVLSHIGICSSYTSIAGTSSTTRDHPDASTDPGDLEGSSVPIPLSERRAGLLRRLSEACRSSARAQVRIHELGHVYDNINWILNAPEQTMGHKSSVESGTCATVFPLFQAPPADMKTVDFLNAFTNAPPLSREDVLLTPAETDQLDSFLEHALLRVIVSHGGDGFTRFCEEVDHLQPKTPDRIALHKTDVYPLRAMNIEEATVKGNAEVLQAMFTELGHDLSSPAFTETVKVVFGDQLSVARVRSVINNRAGHDSFSNSYLFTAFAPGFFHYQMAAAHGLLETHWGSPSLGLHDPASLVWHNTVLDRKPFILSNRPPYRIGRDLIFHSLYGRIIHCLELVSGCEDLEEYSYAVTLGDLKQHVQQIMDRFVNPAAVSTLRSARAREVLHNSLDDPGEPMPKLTQGDMVYENACLFLRDALVLREMNDSIKAGDSGRLVIVLKVLALSYRGSGRTKYAQELLFLIHNLTHVWPKPLKYIIMKNWLVNTTGKANHWLPVDLLQEHNNLWTKTIYSAQGSGASWDWLEMISPCINVLRHLVTNMNDALGSRQGTKHAAPNIARDIEALRSSLAEARVYEIQPGRVIEGDKGSVPNIVSAGLTQLAGPLTEYNKTFQLLKDRRRRTIPLVGATPAATTATMAPRSEGPVADGPVQDLTASASRSVGDSGTDVPAEVQATDETALESDDSEDELVAEWLQPQEFFSLDNEDDVDMNYD
ncbi:uncharacterized protein C8Q71DRAFT_707708 [Rhodofomes roseus]|uniref:DUF6589 domain-containing protein n=1 Tax=Rhodofomes roseus TaxID=34475 RepID=A0ABQ8KFN8_9APHY|nr:uncharacterized protein C8Q71DRAFT_707708 [Rhodofomes roseus]KAH9836596.1 hypothetical protein C8Q71DRAFT_707708 [Rhodofomes roseus]